jgi:hypothetical protein
MSGSTQPREYNWGATWKKKSGFGLESQEYGSRDPSRWPRGTLYPQKLAPTSPTSSGRSVGIVRLRTKATEFFFSLHCFFPRDLKYWTSLISWTLTLESSLIKPSTTQFPSECEVLGLPLCFSGSSLSAVRQLLNFCTIKTLPTLSQDHYLHRTSKTQIFMPRAVYEPTTSVFQRPKTLHSLDRSMTVIDHLTYLNRF